jgi:hypothetical protein
MRMALSSLLVCHAWAQVAQDVLVNVVEGASKRGRGRGHDGREQRTKEEHLHDMIGMCSITSVGSTFCGSSLSRVSAVSAGMTSMAAVTTETSGMKANSR